MVPPADVLIVTATRVESKAVLDAFAELTGQPARTVTEIRRTYRDLGAVGETRVFLALTEIGSGSLGASQQAVQSKKVSKRSVLLVGIAFGVDEKKLVDNLDYRDQLQRLAPEALGGEMEVAGLYVACQDAQVDWIVVKAICDWADGHKVIQAPSPLVAVWLPEQAASRVGDVHGGIHFYARPLRVNLC